MLELIFNEEGELMGLKGKATAGEIKKKGLIKASLEIRGEKQNEVARM